MMPRYALSLPALALALTMGGCAMHHAQHHDQHLGAMLHERPLVYVKSGVISVSPEPVVLHPGAGDKGITWRLPRGTSFDGPGIVVLGRLVDAKGEAVPPTQRALETPGLKVDERQRDAFACTVAEDRQSVRCSPTGKPGSRGVYKYLIRVLHDGKPLSWDPNILHLD